MGNNDHFVIDLGGLSRGADLNHGNENSCAMTLSHDCLEGVTRIAFRSFQLDNDKSRRQKGRGQHVQEVHSHIVINFANISTLSLGGTTLSNLPCNELNYSFH
jgi:hypothetical protein